MALLVHCSEAKIENTSVYPDSQLPAGRRGLAGAAAWGLATSGPLAARHSNAIDLAGVRSADCHQRTASGPPVFFSCAMQAPPRVRQSNYALTYLLNFHGVT